MKSSSVRQGGLTLLEVLVVLTLIGMISSVMFQGYAYMLGSYQRLKQRQLVETREALVAGWWRSSLESVVPYFDDELAFTGSPDNLRGASFSPLWGRSGVATEFRWGLAADDVHRRLIYQEPPHAPVVVREWPVSVEAAFEYLSESGQWKQAWVVGEDRQIPQAIRLSLFTRDADDRRLAESLTAVISIRKSQYVPSQVVLFGRD